MIISEESELWFFQFIDHDKIGALEAEDIIICSEKVIHLDEYTLKNCILGRTKNEAIDILIIYLNGMKDEINHQQSEELKVIE